MARKKVGSNGHLIAISPIEVIEVRSVQRRPYSERWSKETVQALCATPWCWTVRPENAREERVAVEPHDPHVIHEPALAQETTKRLMRAKISQALVRTHGYTPGCHKCDAWRLNRSTTRNHTEECRLRFEGIMRAINDPRIVRADERINEQLADHIRAQEEAEEERAVEPTPLRHI